jgi:uncharacterized protein YndB with AHSA1/START domain
VTTTDDTTTVRTAVRTTDAGPATGEVSVELDERIPAVHIVRDFAASPDAVFRAHADPDLIVRWLGPHGMEMELHGFDCRTGGSYRYTHRDGDDSYGFFGSFHEVRPEDHVIVQTFGFDGAPDSASFERMSLNDLGDGRTRLTATSLFESFEARDQMVAHGMQQGIEEGYERLDDLLAG